MGRYTIYGDLRVRESVTLASVLRAKGLEADLLPETPSLAFALRSRAGREAGPYLRTPEGFVLADLHATLEFLERVHPAPALVPSRPVRRTCARLIEDWLELWLPHWPRRSWGALERLEGHLRASGFLLGPRPMRADWILAGWLETEVRVHAYARRQLDAVAPRLASLGSDLLEMEASDEEEVDDALPVTLLDVLDEIGREYHAYLERNHQALKDHRSHLRADPIRGWRALPVQRVAETRRVETGRELSALDRRARRRVTEFLEPLGAWSALTWPSAVTEMDPSDPRSL